MGRLSLGEARPAAHAAITRAVALAPEDIDSAHTTSILVRVQLALIHLLLDLDYARAEAGFRQAQQQNPKNGWNHINLATLALQEGRTSEALRQLANASEANASFETPIFLSGMAWALCIGGDYDGALKASDHGLKLALGGQRRADILKIRALSLIQVGKGDEAKPSIEEGWSLERSTSPESYVSLFANIGETEIAKKILFDSHPDLVNHYFLAMGYLALGDNDKTFKSIRAGIEDHNQLLIESLIVAEWWNPIRDDPRFSEMLTLLDSKVTHTEQYLLDLVV